MRTLCLFIGLALSIAAIAGTPPSPAMMENLSSAPTGFEGNKGQVRTTNGEAAPFVRFRLSQGNTQLFLLGNGIAYQFSRMHYPEGYVDLAASISTHHDPERLKALKALRTQVRLESYRMDMVLDGADPAALITTEGRSEDYTQYYNHDALDVHTYAKVIYHDVYPGIDWVVYTTENGMKYDFVVHPGADPDQIRMRYEHHEELSIDANGSLIHGNRMGRFTEERPVSFQDGKEVPTSFVLEGNTLRFALDSYDRSRILIIDPARLWGTYYGGADQEAGWSCTTDSNGNVYMAGSATSTTAIASGGHQNTYGGNRDACLIKFNPAGTRLWGTYYGGEGDENGFECATDASGNVYLAGYTGSATAIASGGHQGTFGGDLDAFLVKFTATGTRLWGTYYGSTGYDRGLQCDTDASGNVYLCGETSSGSAIASAGHQNTYGGGEQDAFLVKFSATGTRLWGTYYGGSEIEASYSCAVDGNGNVFLCGKTGSSGSIASGGHQNVFGGGSDAFLVKFSSGGSRLWGTYYGGSGTDFGWQCAVTAAGDVFLAGSTSSTNGIASGGHQNTYGGGTYDAFIARFNASGTRMWGSYYGGANEDFAYSCAVDAAGNSYLAGWTSSTNAIAVNGHQTTYGGGESDAFLAKLDPNGDRSWGTYYGGAGFEGGFWDPNYFVTGRCTVDPSGNVLLAGITTSSTNIATGGHDNSFGGDHDAFLVKFEDRSIVTGVVNGPICTGHPVTVPFTVSGAFNAGNTFTAQLSNASGSFASPVMIGSLSGISSGTINAIVPLGTAPGTGYRIRVVGSNPVVDGSDNGTNLTINDRTTNCSCDDVVEVEPNNSTAATNTLNYDTPISGITGPCSVADNTADYFSFTATTQGVLYVEACLASTGPDPLPVNFRLISSTGATLETFVLEAGANNAPNQDEFYFTCLGIGSYRIAVDNPSTTACSHYTLSYTILEPVFGNDPEPNDAIGAGATPVAHDTYQDGRINFTGETTYDYYSILPPTNGVMNIEVQAEHVNDTPWLMTVQLLSNTGSVLQTWNDVVIGNYSEPATTNLSIPCRSMMNNYHIRISSEGCGISYRIKYTMDAPHFAVDVEPNNTTPGTALAHDTYTEGQIQFDGESTYDHYSITPPTNGVMTFSLEAEHVGGASGTMHLALLNSGGTVQQTWDLIVGANGIPADSVFSITCRAASNYSVRISSTTCGVSYRFKYTMTAPHFATDAEPNNTPPGAALAHDTYAEGQVQFDGDTYDHFSISPPTNGVMTFTLEAEHVGAAPGTMHLALLNSAGTVQQTWDVLVGANGIPADSVFSITCRSTVNPYTVRIAATTCGVSYRWKYTMTAPHFAADVEPNNTQPGTTISHDTYVEGQIQFDAENQYDIFRIAPPTNGVMTFTIEAEHVGATEGTMTLALLNSAGTVQQTWNVPVGANSLPQATTMSITCRSTMNPYSIRLSSATCGVSYRVKYTMTAPLFAVDVEPNNSAPGTPLAHDTYTEGQIQFDAESQYDFYRIVPAANGEVNIELQAEHVGPVPGSITLAFMSGTTVQQSWNIPVGANGSPVTTVVSFTCRTGGTNYDLRLSTATCGTSYKLKWTLVTPVFTNDTEPNGSTSSAIILPETQTTQGQLNFSSENLDTYRLNLSDDGVLNVLIEAEHAGVETNATITAELYLSTSVVLQTWTAPIGANSIPINTVLDRLCLGQGVNYYLRISSSICLTSYRISYTVAPPFFGNDPEPNGGTPGGGGPAVAHDTYREGHINFPGDGSDLFNIVPPINGVMKFEVQAEHAGPDIGQMELRIFTSAGTTIQFWTIPVGANGVPHTSVFSIPCRGSSTDYDIRITSATCGTSYRWKYTMLPAVFPTDAEPNNGTPGSGGSPVAHDTYQDGQIGFDAQTGNDLFNIVAPTNGVMTFEVQAEHAGSAEGTMEFRIYTTAGTTIQLWTIPVGANGVPITSTFSIACRTSTTDYDIGINGVTCGTSYRWKYTMSQPFFANDVEPNGSTSQAIVLPQSTQMTGQLNFGGGENNDYYRINMPEDGVLNVTIEAEHAGISESETITANILISTGTNQGSWPIAVGASSTPSSTSFSLNCRGTALPYYLQLVSNVCGASYRVSWTVTPPVFANDPEPNGSVSSAIVLPASTQATGHLNFHSVENNDQYRIDMPAAGVLNVTIEAEHAGLSASETITANILISTGTSQGVWPIAVGANGTPTSTSFSLNCRGTALPYYLQLVSNVCGASYRVSWTVTPPVYANDIEPNSSTGSATPMNLNNAPQTGHIGFHNQTDDDIYIFSHPGGPWSATVSAEHAGSGSGSLTMAVRTLPTSLVASFSVPAGGSSMPETNTFTIASLGAGTYRLHLSDVTCGVSYRIHCYDDDGDGTCNGFDLCAGGPEPGTPCDDQDALTIDDEIGSDCLCAGTSVSCVDDGDCNDNDPCTLDECDGNTCTFTPFPDGDGDGTCDPTDGCPEDPNKIAPGVCGCGVSDADSDGDLTADCNDGCPADPNKTAPGICGCGASDADTDGDLTADCNDGCPSDPNKTTPGICGCGSSDADSDSDGTADCNDGCPSDPNKTAPGICGCGNLEPGSACDPGPGFENGVINGSCNCVGDPIIVFDCPALEANIGDACDPGPGFENGEVSEACTCEGDPIIVFDCPELEANIGDACDPGPGFENGEVTEACECEGAPAAPCTTDLEFDFTMDSGSSMDWEIREDGTNNLVQSGSTILGPNELELPTCLPDGCFHLIVTDAQGDGITGGGYVLRLDGTLQPYNRIIDNRNNYAGVNPSQVSGPPVTSNAFCIPLGSDRLVFTSCDKMDWKTNPCGYEYIVANANPLVTAQYGVTNTTSGYEMWWFNPNGGYSFRRVQYHNTTNGLSASSTRACHFKLNSWTGNQLQQNVLYNVKVRGIVAGAPQPWGPACRMMIDQAASQCPRTKLHDIPGESVLSCGAARSIASNQLVHARPVRRMNASCAWVNANRYQFRFRVNGQPAQTVVKTSSTNQYFVNTTGLVACRTYEVDVRASFDNGATWCVPGGTGYADPDWGDRCFLYTTGTGCFQGGNQNMVEESAAASMRMFPNPNRGDQLFLSMEAIEAGVSTVSVDIFDAFGKRAITRTIPVTDDGFINTVLELNGSLATGLYMVNINAGEKVYTERLVVQR